MIVAGCDTGSLTAKALIMENGKVLSDAIVLDITRPEDSANEAMQMALDNADLTADEIGQILIFLTVKTDIKNSKRRYR